MEQSRQAIVWAVDPFDLEAKPDTSFVKSLVSWAKGFRFEIQPVYILTAAKREEELFAQTGGLRFQIGKILKEFGLDKALSVTVLQSRGNIRREDIEDLCQYANSQNTPCIVVTSHGRTGIKKWVLGSFAEALLRHANRPVLFLTHCKTSEQEIGSWRKVLFSTDFSSHSFEAFQEFLEEANRFAFDLVLFHAVTLPGIAMSGGYANSIALPDDYFKDQIAWAKQEGERWLKLAQSRGVSARLIVKDEGVGSNIGASVLNGASDEKVSFIAMASTSGPLSSFALGSVGHEVFRANLYPVWVYGPKFNKKSLESAESTKRDNLSPGETKIQQVRASGE